jgi:hypothetical protein
MLGSFVEGKLQAGKWCQGSYLEYLCSAAVAGLHPILPAWMADTKLSPLGGKNREKRGGDQDT